MDELINAILEAGAEAAVDGISDAAAEMAAENLDLSPAVEDTLFDEDDVDLV